MELKEKVEEEEEEREELNEDEMEREGEGQQMIPNRIVERRMKSAHRSFFVG